MIEEEKMEKITIFILNNIKKRLLKKMQQE